MSINVSSKAINMMLRLDFVLFKVEGLKMFYKHSTIGGRIQAADANAYNPTGLGAGEIKGKRFSLKMMSCIGIVHSSISLFLTV